MADFSGDEPLKNNLCLDCSQVTANLNLHICGGCGQIWIDNSQNSRYALVELYRALGVFLATGPREDLDDLMEATQTILDHTKRTMKS